MAKTKYIMHNCAYCHKETKMELVGEMQVEGKVGAAEKVWYRCTRCKHSALLERASLQKSRNGHSVTIDRASYTEYSQEKVYAVGQTIYHAEWQDYGRVIAKQRTSNGIQAITVTFEKLGERRLIENVAPSSELESVATLPH